MLVGMPVLGVRKAQAQAQEGRLWQGDAVHFLLVLCRDRPSTTYANDGAGGGGGGGAATQLGLLS